MRNANYAWKTEKTYIHWVTLFILFNNKQHPKKMGAREIEQYLSHLANERHCSPATQKIALNALIYLYSKFLHVEIQGLQFNPARSKTRLPVVLTHSEVKQVLAELDGHHRLMVELLYGSGVRLNELLNLRVKDLDFELMTITVRSGKGGKDRVTLLPASLVTRLREQVELVKKLHQRDLEDGYGEVYLPYALARKYPNAARETGWQFLFPSSRIGADPRTGINKQQ